MKKRKYDFLVRKTPGKLRRKLDVLFVLVILMFVYFVCRVSRIGLVHGESYTRIIMEQQGTNSRILPYKRGDITDRGGTKLATSEKVYNIIVDVFALRTDEKFLEPTKKALEECFAIKPENIDALIAESPDSRYEVIKKNVPYSEASRFMEIEEDENYPDVGGVWLEQHYKRVYPYGMTACDVIGFSNEANQGVAGIESYYNRQLNGTDGREYNYFAEASSAQRTIHMPTNGNQIVTTIDIGLQSIVEKHIKAFNDEHKGESRKDEEGSKNTAVMIMNPNTGEILAEASYPSFDLNNPYDMSAYISKEKWDAMTQEQKTEQLTGLWKNFCVSDTYEPGSVMKPFTVAAGLETGKLKGDEVYECGGYLHVGDHDIPCHLVTGHGTETIEQAIANSCNVALMEMGAAIGPELFTKYQRIFGFGEFTGVDMPGEADTSALMYTKDTMGVTDLATNSFGQGFNVTMTQMAAAFCSLINGGYYYEPHIVSSVLDESGSVVENKNPTVLKKTISSETSKQLRTYMQAVMTEGTGSPAAVEGYSIGAKTGTAEKLPRNNGKHLLSYAGFAPVDDPEVMIYVVIDEPNVDNQAVSAYVLALSKAIMEEAFPYLNITRSDS